MPKIAVVEEDSEILADLSNALEAEGYRIKTYADGASALDDIHTPDLLILDVAMPRIDEEALRALREKSDVPVILLTSEEVATLKNQLQKPFSQQQFVERVNAVLRIEKPPRSLERALAPEKFTPSEPLVELFHNGLLAQYEILRASSPEEAREVPSLEYARAVLRGRIVRVIASRARRMQLGVLKIEPLCVGGVFDYGFVRELSEYVPFRIDEGTQFFSQLHNDLVTHLRHGGSIAGRWGHLTLVNDEVLIVLKRSSERVPTQDELRALFESRTATVNEVKMLDDPDEDAADSI